MINSIKSIIGGFLAIIVMGLIAQLIFLFVGVGYFSLVKTFPSLSFISEFTTILLFAVTTVVAFIGGLFTAKLARQAVALHCLIVGSMAGALTLVPSLINGYEITINGIVFLIIFIVATIAGGLYWKKQQRLVIDDTYSVTDT